MGLVRFIFRFTMISQNAKYVIQPPIKVSFYQNKKNKSCKGQINHVIVILVNDEILLLVEKNNRRYESFMFIVEQIL